MKTHRISHVVVAAVATVLAWNAPLHAQKDAGEPGTKAQNAASADRCDDLIVELVSLKIDEETGKATLTAYLCNFRPDEVYAAINWGNPVGMKEVGNIAPGEVKAVTLECKAGEVPFDQPIHAQVYNMEVHRLETTDSANLNGKDATTVAVMFEKSAFDEGNRLFGSAARYVRTMIDDLNDEVAKGDSESAATKLRFAYFNTFDVEKEAVPALVKDHPDYDVVIVVGQGSLKNVWTKDGTKALKKELRSHIKSDG